MDPSDKTEPEIVKQVVQLTSPEKLSAANMVWSKYTHGAMHEMN